ncbi:MAG: sugar ABC transporter ATP-binding protein, partial [Planctomycetes bacterium]|nr:sugar ABC transporter ATP-binding protein [Planctomycetota bacterium]
MLAVRGLCKSFPGVRALHDVALTLERGEVLAVIGENGAGKSTLMRILAGIERADAGVVEVDGEPMRTGDVRTAQRRGIALIHQEPKLCGNLSIAANVFLGRELRGRLQLDEASMRARSRALLSQLGVQLDPATPVDRLSAGHRQLVEIAKALAAEARVLIFDEPTSSLSQHEAEQLCTVIDNVRSRGTAVLYISHRLGEVARLADRVLVLRDGGNAGELARGAIEHDAMVRRMVGREARELYAHRMQPPGEVLLELEGLRTAAFPDRTVDLRVRAGEVVGLAGLVGSGRSALLRAVFGIERPAGGTVRVGGAKLRGGTRCAIDAGIALVPEDRQHLGLLLDLSVRDNLQLPLLPRDRGRLGALPRGFDDAAREVCAQLDVRPPDLTKRAGLLSGGNQQKVVLGK